MDNENLSPARQRDMLRQRKMAKPLMEKRRRERINNCLDQLKSLLVEVTKKDEDEEEENSYRNKLEKADILEMTVNYLKAVKRQKLTASASNDAAAAATHSKYVAGFSECAEQVMSYLQRAEGLTPETRSTLAQHLAGCLQQTVTSRKRTSTSASAAAGEAGLVLARSLVSVGRVNPGSGSLISQPIQLLPAQLPTGETVYVLRNASSLNSARPVVPSDLLMTDRGNMTSRASTCDADSKAKITANRYENISPAESPTSQSIDPSRRQKKGFPSSREILQPLPSIYSFPKLQTATNSNFSTNCDTGRNEHSYLAPRDQNFGHLSMAATRAHPEQDEQRTGENIDPAAVIVRSQELHWPPLDPSSGGRPASVASDVSVAFDYAAVTDSTHVWRPW